MMVCQECGKQMNTIHGLKVHMTTVHGKSFKDVDNFPSSEVKIKIEPGMVVTPDPRMKQEDSPRKSHIGPPAKCHMCGLVMGSLAGLRKHELHTHGVKFLYPCSGCGKKFTNRKVYKLHARLCTPGVTTKVKPVRVSVRKDHEKATVPVKNEQAASQENQVSNKAYHKRKCSICKRKFASEFSLKQHRIRAHGVVYCYTCDLCDMKFTRSRELNEHKRDKHGSNTYIIPPKPAAPTTARLFYCAQCQKSFTSYLGLKCTKYKSMASS